MERTFSSMARSTDGETHISSTETFFQVVSTGSVSELEQILKKMEPDVKVRIVDSFNTEGETPLLVAIRGSHNEMVKFLVEELEADIFKTGRFNWKGIEYEEALPLFAAILSDITSDQFIIKFLVLKSPTDVTAAASVLEKIFQKSNTTLQLIDMMELMGAAYILQPNEVGGITRNWLGVMCWEVALHLRNMQSETSALQKPPTTLSAAAQKVFGETTEFRNLDELQEILDSQEFHIRLETQALLVFQRIMSQLDPIPNRFFLRCLFLYSLFWFRNANHYRSCVNVVNLILELLHSRQWIDAIDFDWFENFLTVTLVSVTYSIWIINIPDRSQLPFDGFLEVINYVTDLVFQLQKHPDPLKKKNANYFVAFIADSIRMFVENDKETSPGFKKWLADYIKFTNSHPGLLTILHCTCSSPFLTIKIVQLFTNGKTDPNAQDVDGDTPLHYLAMSKNFPGVEEAVKLLLSVGVHLDLSNKKGVTPLDLFKANKMYLDQKGLFDPYIDELTRTVLPLQCLAAQVIRQNSVPLEDQKIPHSIVSFIENHSAKCGTEGLSQLYFN